jgi:hypothetical protein
VFALGATSLLLADVMRGFPARQALLGTLDLGVLALAAWLLALVIAGQQQNDLCAVGMAEHAQQDLAAAFLERFGNRQAALAQNGCCIMANTELEDPGGILYPLSPGRSADPDPLVRKHVAQRGSESLLLDLIQAT